MSDNNQGDWFNAPPPGQPPVQPGPAGAPQWAAPQQPVQPAQNWAAPTPGQLVADPYGTVEFGTESVEKKGGMGARIAVVGLSLALIGGGAFGVKSALSEPAGPGSADEAAAALFASLEDDDFVGAIELMAPAEREAYVEPMLEMVQEMARVTDTEVGDNLFAELPFDIEFVGLEYEVTELGPGVSWVEVTSGEMDVTFKADELPAWVDEHRDDLSVPDESETETVDLADQDFDFAIIEADGSWYWSAGYTAAEFARQQTGDAVPLFNGTEMAAGADSPEAAVSEAVDALIDFDLKGALSKLDPEEFAVLYDYSDLFIDEGAEAFADLETLIAGEGITYSIDSIEFSSDELRGRTVVSLESFMFSFGDDSESIAVEMRDGCIVATQGEERFDSCEEGGFWGDYFSDGDSDLPDGLEDYMGGITVVERDGKWFISGGPTVFGMYTDILSMITQEDFEQFTDSFDDIMNGVGDPFGLGIGGEEFYDVAESIDDTELSFTTEYDADGNQIDENGEIIVAEEDDWAYDEDYLELDPAFVSPDIEVWSDPPSNSIMVFWFDVNEPTTVTNLFTDDAWIELAEYDSADALVPVIDGVIASSDSCSVVESTLPAGASLFECETGMFVVSYGRWVMSTFEASPQALAVAEAQIAYLQSIGE